MRIVYQVLKTENYLLVVDDSEIKEGDWWVNNNHNSYYIDTRANIESHRFANNSNAVFSNPKKIIAHLPINSPILEGVDLLPPLKDEVDVLALNYANSKSYMSIFHADDFNDFKNGYNKAKETYKYTEEDLKEAYERGMNNIDFDGCAIDKPEEDINDFIQSLQQPKLPVAFIRTDVKDNEWLGKYIY